MRRIAALGFVAALGLAATGLTQATSFSPTLTGACAKDRLQLVAPGNLSLATDNPAYPPWWGGDPGKGFKVSSPYSGKGYESAVAYAVAKRLGFKRTEVTWNVVPFVKSYAPGKKTFDWYMAQVSYSPERAKAVDFSASYYDVNQAIVALKGNPITKAKSIAALRPFVLGAPIATTSYSYARSYIKPKRIKVYDTLNDAVAKLKSKQIDGLVVDFPSTGYITGVQVPGSTVVGRLPNQGPQERFGMVFGKGSTLDACVNKALAAMRRDGTLRRLENRWLSQAGGAPLLKK